LLSFEIVIASDILQVGSPFQTQVPSSDGGDSSFALFSLMLFFFMISSWRRMRNNNDAPDYVAE
jgi:hypothetical protein